jgi:hypothetical protein
MKRSTQVSLVLMGAVGVGGTAYAVQSSSCKPPPPSAVASDAPQNCRSSWHGSSYSGRSGWYFFSGSGSRSSGSGSASTASSSPGSGSRGGFGATGHAGGSSSGGS